MDVIPVEEKVRIYTDWKESYGTVTMLSLGDKYHRDRRTIKKIIAEENEREEKYQKLTVDVNGQPDMDKLKHRAWVNIVTSVYLDNDIQVSKMILNNDIKWATKQATPEQTAEKEAVKDPTKGAVEAFIGG